MSQDVGKDTKLIEEESEIAERLYQLARNSEFGINGYRKNLDKAKALYGSAVLLGHLESTCCLGFLLQDETQENVRRAKQLYEKAAARGHARATNNLGLMFHNGPGGMTKNGVKAQQLYKSAIEKGNDLAIYNLGRLLKTGANGVPADLVRTRNLYEQAASKGVHYAMYDLGSMYEHGNTAVEKDLAEALDLYKQAAELGNVNARNRLKVLAPKIFRSISAEGSSAQVSSNSNADKDDVGGISDSLREDLNLIDSFIERNAN